MNAWEALPNEPVEAYDRFVEYCSLGPDRTLEELWRQRCALTGNVERALPRRWIEAARRFEWDRRSQAWDEAGSAHAVDLEHLRASAERRYRLKTIHRALLLGMRLLDAAGLETLEAKEARALVPTARQLVRDMLAAQRAEAAAGIAAGEAGKLRFYAEDFAAAERAAREELGLPMPTGVYYPPDATQIAAEFAAERARTRESDSRSTPRLLICLGEDPQLEVDLAMLRGVRVRTGLGFHALQRVTRESLARSLRRARAVGRPVRYLHLACHANTAGVEFADGMVDGAWLSARLEGVEVLLIAACHGDQVGDWLRVVPNVVTFDDELPHAEAATLTFAFWERIARGLSATDALNEALGLCSPDVGEYVVRHW